MCILPLNITPPPPPPLEDGSALSAQSLENATCKYEQRGLSGAARDAMTDGANVTNRAVRVKLGLVLAVPGLQRSYLFNIQEEFKVKV